MKSKPAALDQDNVFRKALSLHQSGKFHDAAACYEQLIDIFNDNPKFLTFLGTVYYQLDKIEESVRLLTRAKNIDPDQPMTLINLGLGLNKLTAFEEALANLDRVISLRPDLAEAYCNRGIILKELHRFGEALESCDRAISLKPNYAEAHSNRGQVLYEGFGRLDEAMLSLERAISLKPDLINAHLIKGALHQERKCFQEALACYERAVAINPDTDFAVGLLTFSQLSLCDWHELSAHIDRILIGTSNKAKISVPFTTLAITGSPEIQRSSAEIYVSAKFRSGRALPGIQKYPRHDKIRIGYFSADFHNHATMHLMAGLFEHHDRSKFELIAFSFGPDTQDAWRSRAVKSFDRFIDVNSRSDMDITLLARSMEIDIAVDLKGFTKGCRTGIFAERAAPIQVNYLGYPGTMGADYIDYLIADSILIPEVNQSLYSEKIVYLPNCYQVNDSSRELADSIYTRSDVGLPETGFVFCCFNNSYKIMPDVFDVWMRILSRVDGSVLWLYESDPNASDNLRKEAVSRGLDASRLVFAAHMPTQDHLARTRLADLFLDTFPYNAHTTASDALRAGLPIVTYAGETFASRVAASLLYSVGLPELVTSSLQDYQSLAIDLAENKHKLAIINERLRTNLPSSPLFDTALFARHIESAYVKMYSRYQNDLGPDNISVAP